MLRTSLISWIALSAALLVLGLWLGNVVLLSGAVFVLLVALLSATLSPPAGVTVQRSLPHSTCWAGDTLTISRKLTVRRGVGPVFVHDMLPSELRVVEGTTSGCCGNGRVTRPSIYPTKSNCPSGAIRSGEKHLAVASTLWDQARGIRR